MCDGAVLYHAHVARSKAETSAQQAAKDEAAKLRTARRQQQEENVRRKEVRVCGWVCGWVCWCGADRVCAEAWIVGDFEQCHMFSRIPLTCVSVSVSVHMYVYVCAVQQPG
jgi:hypothetical protein